jgi:glycosyltransferase involved in cell wall biosynthesis
MQPNDSLSGRDIVITGQQPWDTEIGSNCKNIALEFAKNNRVLYVNSPLDRNTRLKQGNDPKVQKRMEVIQKKRDGVEVIQPNLWNLYPDCLIESINWIKNHAAFCVLNKRNNKNFAQSITKALEMLQFRDIILFNDNDMFRSFHLKELLHPAVSIYYSRDFMLAVEYWKRHGEHLEPKLIAKSDICLANSTYLANYCGQYNPNSHYVGQGCELDMFMGWADKTIPQDMTACSKPIVGYVGALQSIRLDIELLAYIAEQRQDWQMVLVGPEDEVFKQSRLHSIKNIAFLGAKKPSELPQYIQAFDVCLNPQLVNQVTIGNYPRKIDEYLAMGKPVVATATEAMSIFAEHCYLAATKEDYINLIDRALTEHDDRKAGARKNFAATHTWENSVKEIYKSVNEFESRKKANRGK